MNTHLDQVGGVEQQPDVGDAEVDVGEEEGVVGQVDDGEHVREAPREAGQVHPARWEQQEKETSRGQKIIYGREGRR